MIFCNGHPKSGTHILVQTLARLGYRKVQGLMHSDMVGGGGLDASRTVIKHQVTRQVTRANGFWHYDNETFVHSHIAPSGYAEIQDHGNHKVLYITRIYKNQAISWLRWKSHLSEENLLKLFARGGGRFGRFGRSNAVFDRWLDFQGDDVCCVDFETYFPAGIEKVCAFLGKKVPHDWPQTVYGRSDTWSGSPSDWLSCPVWTERVEEEYQRAIKNLPPIYYAGPVEIQPVAAHHA